MEIKGRIELKIKADGTTLNTVHFDLKAGIPIIGGKLEDLVAGDLGKTIEGERDFILSWMRTQV